MIDSIKYLYKKQPNFQITPLLSIRHPLYEDIVEYGEEKYIDKLYKLLMTQFDCKSVLYDDYKVDWNKVTDFEFFCTIYKVIDDNFVFTTPLSKYRLYQDNITKEFVLYNPNTDDVLKVNHIKIIREHINSMLGYWYKEHREIAANNSVKELMLEEDRKQIEHNKHKDFYHPSCKDIILSALYHEFENVHDKVDSEYKHIKELAESSWELGKVDTLVMLSEKMYKDLKEKTNE